MAAAEGGGNTEQAASRAVVEHETWFTPTAEQTFPLSFRAEQRTLASRAEHSPPFSVVEQITPAAGWGGMTEEGSPTTVVGAVLSGMQKNPEELTMMAGWAAVMVVSEG